MSISKTEMIGGQHSERCQEDRLQKREITGTDLGSCSVVGYCTSNAKLSSSTIKLLASNMHNQHKPFNVRMLSVSTFILILVNTPSFLQNLFLILISHLEYFYIQESPVTTGHLKIVCSQHELPHKNTTDTQDQHQNNIKFFLNNNSSAQKSFTCICGNIT